MDTNKIILNELVKKLKMFSETYVPNEPFEYNKKTNSSEHKKHSQRKIDSQKRHKKRLTAKLKKMKLNDNNNNHSKNDYRHRHRHNTNILLTNNFHETNEFYKCGRYKSQDKIIKKNLVNQKFKIADDFNEKNSNEFLNEKDECLREEILTDEIKDEESVDFNDGNEKESRYKLLSIKKNKINENLNSRQVNNKIAEDDSESFLTKLIEEIK